MDLDGLSEGHRDRIGARVRAGSTGKFRGLFGPNRVSKICQKGDLLAGARGGRPVRRCGRIAEPVTTAPRIGVFLVANSGTTRAR